MASDRYVLITPAHDEELSIEATLRSVAAQSLLPVRWVVVSDRSTDRTEEIVQDYASRHPFIRLLRVEGRGEANFGAKVAAFRVGSASLDHEEYAFIGNLDADISVGSNYYANILNRFDTQSDLGLAGGIILELVGKRFVPQRISPNSVAGAVQLFRRKCFEAIGGYIPLRSGSIDTAAEIMVRMQGWQVRTFSEYEVFHHRRVRIGARNSWSAKFRQGMNNYRLGYHPVFQCASSFSRLLESPFLAGSALSMLGYLWAYCAGERVVLSEETVQYLRSEQLDRLRVAVERLKPGRKSDSGIER